MDRRKFLIDSGKAILGASFSPVMSSPSADIQNERDRNSKAASPLSLFLSGDVMTGRGIDQVLPHSVNPRLHEPYINDARDYVKLARRHSGSIPDRVPYDYIWGEALGVLEQLEPDHAIVNLETAVTTNDNPWEGKRIHYRMHPGNTPVLSAAGIDACVLGNNHMVDWGRAGLLETLESLRDEGIATAGAGPDRDGAVEPAVLGAGTGSAANSNSDSSRLLLFSWATPGAGAPAGWSAEEGRPGINYLPNLNPKQADAVIEAVERYRKPGDRTVISLHWGGNWGYDIPSRQQQFAHRLIDAGAADIVHGHSSHHPKGIEVYDGRPVLYGCGDLINDYEGIGGHEQFRSELSLLYFPTLDPTGRLSRFEMVPMKIHRFRLVDPSEEEIEWLARTLYRECGRLGTSVERAGDEQKFVLRWAD